MIIGIGTDMIEIERVLKSCQNPRFLERYYTQAERELIQKRKCRCATHFAAKEAVSKVLGTGFRSFTPKEIEVLRNELGKPYVVLYGRALELSRSLGIERIHISLTDTKEYAAAFAIGEGADSCNIS
ncbi:MAG: holo-ACP synthase [Lachnospiraceae bacterium]|nr:holo-ACP synthase [Lachnospiraceae bacterium]